MDQTAPALPPSPDKSRRALLALLGIAALAFALQGIFGRSAWYDEYYTFYVTRADAPFATLWNSWMRDNHPPLFYLLSWATGWLGDTVPPRRLVNLLFAAFAAAALWRIARARPTLKPVLFVYAVGLASAPPVIARIAELRSNFLAYAAGAVAVAALAAFARPGDAASRRGPAMALGAALAVAFSIHLAATIIVGAVAAAFGLRLVLARDWPGVRRMALVGLVAALPFAASMAVQLGTIAGNTRSFWITGGFDAARWAIENEIIAALTANLPLTLAGLAGLALICWQDLRARHLSEPLAIAITLGAGLALALVALVAIHLQRPFVIGRYLICLHPIIAMALAVGVADLLGRLGRVWRIALSLALVAGALASLAAQTRATRALPGWDGTARAIAATVRACPGTVVHAATAWNRAVVALPPAENRAVIPFAYGFVAARHGFVLAPAGSRAMAQGCPTLFWAEHYVGDTDNPVEIAARLRAMGYRFATGRLTRLGDGWVFAAH
jgi:hypothetical protein